MYKLIETQLHTQLHSDSIQLWNECSVPSVVVERFAATSRRQQLQHLITTPTIVIRYTELSGYTGYTEFYMNIYMHASYIKMYACEVSPENVLKATTTVLLTMVTCDCSLHSAVRVAS